MIDINRKLYLKFFSQVFRIVLRCAVRDRRRSTERGGRIVRGGHLDNRTDSRVLVCVEPPVEQGTEGRVTRIWIHANGW